MRLAPTEMDSPRPALHNVCATDGVDSIVVVVDEIMQHALLITAYKSCSVAQRPTRRHGPLCLLCRHEPRGAAAAVAPALCIISSDL